MGTLSIDVDSVSRHLIGTRVPIDLLRAPSCGGVYAYFLRDGMSLRPFAPGELGIIYVGVSKDLSAREFDQHFNSESTGFSTLRRSIGAILKKELRLTAIPRGPGDSETNVSSYRFLPDDEVRLTDWMRRGVEVAVCGVGDSDALEIQLIGQLRPLLNLTHWPNPNRTEIKCLRRVCADEARANRSKNKVE